MDLRLPYKAVNVTFDLLSDYQLLNYSIKGIICLTSPVKLVPDHVSCITERKSYHPELRRAPDTEVQCQWCQYNIPLPTQQSGSLYGHVLQGQCPCLWSLNMFDSIENIDLYFGDVEGKHKPNVSSACQYTTGE